MEDMCYERRAETHEEPGTLTQGAPVFPGSSRLGIEPKTQGWLVQDPTDSPSAWLGRVQKEFIRGLARRARGDLSVSVWNAADGTGMSLQQGGPRRTTACARGRAGRTGQGSADGRRPVGGATAPAAQQQTKNKCLCCSKAVERGDVARRGQHTTSRPSPSSKKSRSRTSHIAIRPGTPQATSLV